MTRPTDHPAQATTPAAKPGEADQADTLEAIHRPQRRCPGALKGLMQPAEAFFEPLSEEELRLWEGGDVPN